MELNTLKFPLYDILLSLSNAADLVTPELCNHHQQVATLAYRLAEQMQLPEEEQRDILIAGLMHDIGAISISERLALIDSEAGATALSVHHHAFQSAKLLEEFAPFASLSAIVRYHHVPWDHGKGRRFGGNDVPFASHLLHIADRTCVMIKKSNEVIAEVPAILEKIRSEAGERFLPQAADALAELGDKEYIWLELIDNAPLDFLQDATSELTELNLDQVLAISKLFSHVIDFRSRFTATHSAGVAKTAEKLGEIAGFSPNECKMLLIAGYLHDLGKLSIPNDILEKPAGLNQKEYGIIRSHTFYTYRLLSTIRGFETINKWAAFHHERMNGGGYPFHLTGEDIPLGSRIMAVADVFTAITEHRPYRQGMEKEQIKRVLETMADNGSLCGKTVALLLHHFDLLTDICVAGQKAASEDFTRFFSEGNF